MAVEEPEPPRALTSLLHDSEVSWDVLHERYGSMLDRVETHRLSCYALAPDRPNREDPR